MRGDFAAFSEGVSAKLGMEGKMLSDKAQMNLKSAAAVMDLAKEAVAFLQKRNEIVHELVTESNGH